MTSLSKALGPASLVATLLIAGAPSAYADALSTPSLSGPLVANPNPMNFDAGPLGSIYVTGQVSGLFQYESNHSSVPNDNETLVDFSNAQVEVQKTTGWFQFYAQVGGYSLPDLGVPYVRATTQTANSYGVLPVGYLKIAPTDSFNVEAGKLPTLIGAESTFSFQNLDIERGLLWNQEPAVSRGVQANYTQGPITASVSLNDGFYSNRYNWLSGSLAYAISSSDTLTAVGGGNLGHTHYGAPLTGPSVANPTPLLENSGSIFNLIWTHTSGPWTVTPYAQYSNVPSVFGLPSASVWGGAVLANYAFNPNWSLGGRVEYVSSSSASFIELYGPGSHAWSFTVTPTYQYKVFFARAEASYVGVGSGTPGFELGENANKTNQVRLLIETGVLF
jgi:hypothetical protein